MNDNDKNEVKVRVRFQTDYPQYLISDAPFAIPSSVGRQGMSEIINHLLGNEGKLQPFDFTVNDKLIRSTLFHFITEQSISRENIITVYYFPAVSFADSSTRSESETSAWIGCLDCTFVENIIVGCYDGTLRLFDENISNEKSVFQAHNEPVRAVKSIKHQDNSVTIISASKDQSIRCWVKNGVNNHINQSAQFIGHLNSVESLLTLHSPSNDKQIIVSGDWSGNICYWEMNPPQSDNRNLVQPDVVKKKKRKGSNNQALSNDSIASEVLTIFPTFTLKAHAQSVSGLCFGENGSFNDNDPSKIGNINSVMYSSSWDHSIHKWDIDRQDKVETQMGSKVITSLDYSNKNNLLVTSHPDGKARLWDFRQNSSSVGSYGSQKTANWISQAKWSPNSSYIFSTVDYAGQVGLWDLRTSMPLGMRAAHDGKVFCLDWISDKVVASSSSQPSLSVISGGSDCNLVKTSVI